MEEEQYIWYNCIYFLWLVLAHPCKPPSSAQDGTGRGCIQNCYGRLSFHVGPLHPSHVHKHLKLNRALQFVFGSLTLLFFLLALGDATGNASISTIAVLRASSADFPPYTKVWLRSSMRFMARSWSPSGPQKK